MHGPLRLDCRNSECLKNDLKFTFHASDKSKDFVFTKSAYFQNLFNAKNFQHKFQFYVTISTIKNFLICEKQKCLKNTLPEKYFCCKINLIFLEIENNPGIHFQIKNKFFQYINKKYVRSSRSFKSKF